VTRSLTARTRVLAVGAALLIAVGTLTGCTDRLGPRCRSPLRPRLPGASQCRPHRAYERSGPARLRGGRRHTGRVQCLGGCHQCPRHRGDQGSGRHWLGCGARSRQRARPPPSLLRTRLGCGARKRQELQRQDPLPMARSRAPPAPGQQPLQQPGQQPGRHSHRQLSRQTGRPWARRCPS